MSPRPKAARIGQDDVRGKIVRLTAKPIAQPRPQNGKTVQTETRVGLKRRWRVISRVGDHRANHRQLIGDTGNVREEVRNPDAALAALLELPVVLPNEADLSEERLGLLGRRERLAVILLKQRLVVKRIEVTHPTAQEDMNYALALRRKMRRRIGRFTRSGGLCRQRLRRSIRSTQRAVSLKKTH